MTLSLSIAIPTFRREKALLRRVAEISAYRELIDTVVVLDNDPASELTHTAFPDYVIYRQNVANVGACANFIRLLEYCPRDGHVWLRGDDDVLPRGIVEQARRALNDGDCDVLLLTSAPEGKLRGTGLKDFVSNPCAIRASKWLSGVVIPASQALDSLPSGYFGVGSGWSHVTLLLGMFERFPALRFKIIGIEIQKNAFRDVGRLEGMKYAFFRMNFEYFPMTAKAISDPDLQRTYLDAWRKGVSFRYLKPLVRLRLGQMAGERIRYGTFSALFSFGVPRSWLLTPIYLIISATPRSILTAMFAIYVSRKSTSWRENLALDFLGNSKNPVVMYKSLIAGRHTTIADHIY